MRSVFAAGVVLMRGARWALGWIIVALSALLTLGSFNERDRALTRGIPETLSGPIADSALRLGVNVQLEQYDDAQLAQTLAAIAATEFQVIKQSFYFSAEFNFQQTDRLFNALAAHDLQIVPLLDGDPAKQFASEDSAEFAAWASQFATRYGDQIKHYIIWDEPNLASHWGGEKVNPDEYAALLNAAGVAIKAVDPNAVIVAAPLAPTTETGSINLSDPHYLQKLYEAGATFDVVAGKPYGFDQPPTDRTVRLDTLNFSRAILLREVMLHNGDGDRALWAGNWGWNALSADWQGQKSIWGDTTKAEQVAYTQAALERAQTEWPWMGTMFLEHWEPDAASDDPSWGFSVANSALLDLNAASETAASGFWLAAENSPYAAWDGDWRFSEQFGADSSEKYAENGDRRDRVTFEFWGTEIGLRVRRADFRSRFYVTVDGQPANLRPSDEFGTTVVLDSPNPNEDYIVIEPIANNLTAGKHTLEVIAHRGWDQWALNGFSVGYRPATTAQSTTLGLLSIALASAFLALRAAAKIEFNAQWQARQAQFLAFSTQTQLILISGLVALMLSVIGWHFWGSQLLSIYRRLGDWQQLALTASMAAVFFVTPWFLVYLLALALLLVLISFRPNLGLVLIAFSIPFYGRAQMVLPLFGPTGLYKSVLGRYIFSPTEIFTFVLLGAVILRWLVHYKQGNPLTLPTLKRIDWAVLAFVAAATLSIAFTERRDVAINEWRWIILEPALFYGLIRYIKPSQKGWWLILNSFVLSGIVVALYGLAQALFGFQDLITAEFGLQRVQSIYGSPNNVTLYFGRILPLLLAILLFAKHIGPSKQLSDNDSITRQQQIFYGIAVLLLGVTFILTISKGGILVGMPIALLILLGFWLRSQGRHAWPYLLGCVVLGVVGFFVLLQIPQLAGRLDLFGATSFVRVNLWRASLEMIREQPWFGVGMDNFLYAHRGRYILEAAWREPALNHPHNIVLDFATRLGLVGLLAGGWMFWEFGRILHHLTQHLPKHPFTIGLVATLGYILAHGLVDHSYFLVDLAFSFFLLVGLANALVDKQTASQP
ncbi:MAG: O-antigen ligase family protein [Candidatus Promineifilaceae bacterium]